MTFKNAMLRAVLTVITDCKHPKNLEDNDIAFLEAAGNYGASLDKAANNETGTLDIFQGNAGAAPMPKAMPLSAFKGGTGPAVQQPAEIDRGPEPQTIGDTLDPETPLPAASNQDVNQDEDAPVILSTKRS